METILENTKTQYSNATSEAQKHNAMINERYRKLQSAEAYQFAEDTYTAQETVAAPSVYADSTENVAASVQTPQVTEYVPTASASALFTTEKFERMQGYEEAVEVAPVVVAAPFIAAPVTSVRVKTEAQYSLTPFAKMVMAIFTLVIVAMISMICVNTHLINQKRVKIQNLEKKKEQLMEQSEELQRRIEEARSEEAIRAYAEAHGW